MGLAIAGAAFGLLPAAISFTTGVLLFMALRIVPLRKVYEEIDWPVIVLLGALIPVAGAMGTTGTADLLATQMLDSLVQGKPVIALVVILVVTMTLSDFMNNAATAAVMCPIAISTATQLGDGGCSGRLLRIPHAGRSPEQYADSGTRRLSIRRLLETGPADGSDRRCNSDTLAVGRVAALSCTAVCGS
jgi:hypothetical protein